MERPSVVLGDVASVYSVGALAPCSKRLHTSKGVMAPERAIADDITVDRSLSVIILGAEEPAKVQEILIRDNVP